MGRRKREMPEEKGLRAALAERDLELVSVDERLPDGTIAASANKLHLVPTPSGEPLYAPIPVALRIQCDASGKIRTLTGDAPVAGAIADATRFVASLIASHKVADAHAAAPPGATHQVETDAKGRRVLRRRRFAAS
jgi:hypothetical protein